MADGFGSTITFNSQNGKLAASGPEPVKTLFIPTVEDPIERIEFTALNSDSATPTPTPLMNISNQGIGVGNNIFNGVHATETFFDEQFRIDPLVNDFTQLNIAITGTGNNRFLNGDDQISYTITYDDGTTTGPFIIDEESDLISLEDSANPGQFNPTIVIMADPTIGKIDYIDLSMDFGEVKIGYIEVIVEEDNPANDMLIDFQSILTDADGDSATTNFAVDLFANDLDSEFDFTLDGNDSDWDTFDIDLSAFEETYQILGFDTPDDTLVFLQDSAATYTIDNNGVDSIITINETDPEPEVVGQITEVTVVGSDVFSENVEGIVFDGYIAPLKFPNC